MASSSRSSARPLGRWQLQPSWPQDAPDVSLVIAHPAPVLDQLAHPVRGPQPGSVSERLGSALERVFDLLELGATQSGLAPSPSGLLQTRFTGLRKLPRPANHRLPMHPKAPRHFALAYALAEQLGGLHPAPRGDGAQQTGAVGVGPASGT